MSESTVERLNTLLNTERAALITGDLEAVAALSAEKDAITLTFEGGDVSQLQKLSGALMHNEALLSAAREGVQTALSTLRNQRAARTTLSGYDSTGNATVIERAQRSTERRF